MLCGAVYSAAARWCEGVSVQHERRYWNGSTDPELTRKPRPPAAVFEGHAAAGEAERVIGKISLRLQAADAQTSDEAMVRLDFRVADLRALLAEHARLAAVAEAAEGAQTGLGELVKSARLSAAEQRARHGQALRNGWSKTQCRFYEDVAVLYDVVAEHLEQYARALAALRAAGEG